MLWPPCGDGMNMARKGRTRETHGAYFQSRPGVWAVSVQDLPSCLFPFGARPGIRHQTARPPRANMVRSRCGKAASARSIRMASRHRRQAPRIAVSRSKRRTAIPSRGGSQSSPGGRGGRWKMWGRCMGHDRKKAGSRQWAIVRGKIMLIYKGMAAGKNRRTVCIGCPAGK